MKAMFNDGILIDIDSPTSVVFRIDLCV